MGIELIRVPIGLLNGAPRDGYGYYFISDEEIEKIPVRGPTLRGRLASWLGLVHPHETWTWVERRRLPFGVGNRVRTLPCGEIGVYEVRKGTWLQEFDSGPGCQFPEDKDLDPPEDPIFCVRREGWDWWEKMSEEKKTRLLEEDARGPNSKEAP